MSRYSRSNCDYDSEPHQHDFPQSSPLQFHSTRRILVVLLRNQEIQRETVNSGVGPNGSTQSGYLLSWLDQSHDACNHQADGRRMTHQKPYRRTCYDDGLEYRESSQWSLNFSVDRDNHFSHCLPVMGLRKHSSSSTHSFSELVVHVESMYRIGQ